jgi:hypothetical protein
MSITPALYSVVNGDSVNSVTAFGLTWSPSEVKSLTEVEYFANKQEIELNPILHVVAELLTTNMPIPEYASNVAALAGGLVDGQLYRETAYPHTVRSVIVSSLITSDGYTLYSSDDLELTPYIY